jgi:uncharacterized membrane protein YoaK (UPF0700 family)
MIFRMFSSHLNPWRTAVTGHITSVSYDFQNGFFTPQPLKDSRYWTYHFRLLWFSECFLHTSTLEGQPLLDISLPSLMIFRMFSSHHNPWKTAVTGHITSVSYDFQNVFFTPQPLKDSRYWTYHFRLLWFSESFPSVFHGLDFDKPHTFCLIS